MNVGTTRIANVLLDELEINEIDPRRRALRLMLSGSGVSILLSSVCVMLLQVSTASVAKYWLIPFLGLGLLAVSIGLGSALHKASGETREMALKRFLDLERSEDESAVGRLVWELYQSFGILTQGQGSLTPTPAASVLVSHLLDNGVTPESRLEGCLASAGYSKNCLISALSLLEQGGIITRKANGVSLVPAKKRLFL